MSRLLDKLNDRQKEAVTQIDGPLLVVAGAGSGKTRVLTHRLAHIIDQQKAKPWEILAVTFTNKAAGEMKERIGELVGFDVSRMWVSTFHRFAARFLRMESDAIGYPSNFTIADTDDSKSLIKRAMNELGLNSGSQFTPDSVMRKISSAKNKLYDATQYAAEADGYYDQQVAKVFNMYEKKLIASHAFDFDDLIGASVKLLSANDDIRQKWQSRFRYLLVDEYQDTNRAQYLLLRNLVGPEKNICVVGDEDQSIYGWRGADISNILNFEKDYSGGKVVMLEQNYRSTQTILQAASATIKNNLSRKDKTLWSDIEGGDKIKISLQESQTDEADWVVRRATVLRERFPLKEMVVLYRTNAQSRAFEEILRRANMPYQIVGGISFYQRKEIKDIVAYLKLISNPSDEASFVRTVNYPKRALGQASLARLSTYAAENNMSLLSACENCDAIVTLGARPRIGFKAFAQLINKLRDEADKQPIDNFIRHLLEETGLHDALRDDDPLAGEARLENIDEFIAAAADFFHRHEEPTLDNFLAEITLYTNLDNYQDTDDRLTLMTLHNAKGLEYDVVFITGLEEGLFPMARAFDNPSELEEERRLLYVGITRARKVLKLTAARFRFRFGGEESVPSRFIKEIPDELTEKIDNRSYRYEFGKTSKSQTSMFSKATHAAPKPEGMHYEYEDEEGIRRGNIVHHPKFGQGRIINVSGSGESMRLDVDFASVGPKKLIAKYANLTVISQ